MFSPIDIRQPDTASQVYRLQQAAYTVESQLIGYPELPPLRETAADLQRSDEQFLAWWEQGQMVGVVSYLRQGETVEICRLVVSPAYFRRGIAGKLLAAVETGEPDIRQITVSTAEKNLPAVNKLKGLTYYRTRINTDRTDLRNFYPQNPSNPRPIPHYFNCEV